MCDIVGLTDSIVNLEKNVRKMYKSKRYIKKKKNTSRIENRGGCRPTSKYLFEDQNCSTVLNHHTKIGYV
jgi:hypothetical protein